MKSTFRKQIKTQLQKLTQQQIQQNSQIIYEKLLTNDILNLSKTIGIYYAKDYEIHTKNIITFLLETGKTVCLPVINNKQLIFKKISSLDDLVTGTFDIQEPKPSCQEIQTNSLDPLIVPCLAINENGYRLGRGGGFYDRLLEQNKNIHSMCLAHEEQIVSTIPVEPHDKKVDCIITEKRIIYTAKT